MDTRNQLLSQINQLKFFLLANGYAPDSVHLYQPCWNKLLVYAKEVGCESFSRQLGINFLKSEYGVTNVDQPDGKGKKPARAINLLACYLETGSLAKYQNRTPAVPEQFSGVFSQYVSYLSAGGQRPKSLKSKKSRVRQFLKYLDDIALPSVAQLTKKDLLGFMSILSTKHSSVGRGNVLYTVKDFLLFCVSSGIVSAEIPKLIKCINTNPNETMPAVYSSDEVRRILESVDRCTLNGKKAYAILVLAAVLGIRASDIIHMKIEDIKWDQGHIEFYQQKTGFFVQLPLPTDVQYALADYLKNSRPTTDHPNVFVRSRAPIAPYVESATIFRIVSRHIQLAGISVDGRSHGPHALRHSMASGMLRNRESLPVIASALGHGNTKNTSRYLRIDIDRLRTVALEVPR